MAAKRVAVIQSSYIPWKGYFDLIRSADQFVLLDDVQFTKRDWRSRNRIKTKDGGAWLSIPVHTNGRYLQRIDEATISDPGWASRHWDTIRHSYAGTPFFDAFAPFFEPLYMKPISNRLSDVNHQFLLTICRLLGITTPIAWSTEYSTRSGPSERLVDICLACGATEYLSGPTARNYLDEAPFRSAGISIRFADYSGYPGTLQPHPPFDHAVSTLDLLFCTGPKAIEHMKDVCSLQTA